MVEDCACNLQIFINKGRLMTGDLCLGPYSLEATSTLMIESIRFIRDKLFSVFKWGKLSTEYLVHSSNKYLLRVCYVSDL